MELLQQPLEHQRAERQHLAPRPGDLGDAFIADSFLALRISSQKAIASFAGMA